MKREEGSEGWPLSGCLGEVCRPQAMGGVGISSFPELCWALIMRWLWLEKTNPTKPWIDLENAGELCLIILRGKEKV